MKFDESRVFGSLVIAASWAVLLGLLGVLAVAASQYPLGRIGIAAFLAAWIACFFYWEKL